MRPFSPFDSRKLAMIEPVLPLAPKITYMPSLTTATVSLGLFIFVSPFRRARFAIQVRVFICSDNLHIYTQKNSLAHATDFPNYIGERYSSKAILEALLRCLCNRRHVSLTIATNRPSFLH